MIMSTIVVTLGDCFGCKYELKLKYKILIIKFRVCVCGQWIDIDGVLYRSNVMIKI